MRLRTSLPPILTAAALALGLTAPASAAPRPSCATPQTGDFPLKTRIHGGPTAYEAGGDFETWYIDLTNTTAHTCGGIHPVVVLVDQKRALRPGQARLEFYEGERTHAVTFQKSDRDENVGAFDDGFPGFTVGPGRTLTVKVRLSLTSDATAPNDIVANAAVVQRHNDDGDWVGQSNDYRFRVGDGGEDPVEAEAEDQAGRTGIDGGASASASTGSSTSTSTGSGDGSRSGSGDTAGERATPSPDELARTGHGAPHWLGLTAGLALLAVGAALLAASRRSRPRRP
ncbi:hypothetical protein AB0D27_02790 [Streptomyces sp. NPDC048415]|uniref:hypothetical protein n=1 Tax=Streptomyces sp. NPDC048415 TaxID=3154822 RepID=UPI00342731D0